MAKKFTLVLGIVLLGLGLWGLVRGGHNHVWIFNVNALHNFLHVVTGVLALLASTTGERYSQMYCLVFGTLYGLIAVGGFFAWDPVVLTLNINMPDNFLNLFISVACLWVGGISKGK